MLSDFKSKVCVVFVNCSDILACGRQDTHMWDPVVKRLNKFHLLRSGFYYGPVDYRWDVRVENQKVDSDLIKNINAWLRY